MRWILLLFFCSANVVAQNSCDSLHILVNKHSENYERQKLYTELISYLDLAAEDFRNCEYHAEALEWVVEKFYVAQDEMQTKDAHRYLSQFDEAVANDGDLLSIGEKLEFELISLRLWASFFQDLGYSSKSLTYLEEVNSLLHDSVFINEDIKSIALRTLKDLGDNYRRSGFNTAALQVYTRVIEVAAMRQNELVGLTHESLIKGKISEIHMDLGYVEDAMKHARERILAAKTLVEIDNLYHPHLIHGYKVLAEIHLFQGKLDSVNFYIEELEFLNSAYNYNKYPTEQLKINLLLAKGEFEKAKATLTFIINEHGGYESFFDERDDHYCLTTVRNLIKCQAYEEAKALNDIILYKLQVAIEKQENRSPFEKNNLNMFYLEGIKNQLSIPLDFTLNEQIAIAYQGYGVLEEVKNSIYTLEDQLFFSQESADISSKLLALLPLGNAEIHPIIFYAIESAKSRNLLASWKEHQLQTIQEEKSIFNLEIYLVERIKDETKQFLKAKGEIEGDSIATIIAKYSEQLGDVKSFLSKRHELYYSMKYAWEIPELEDFQNILNEGERFINYFESGGIIYALSISHRETEVIKIEGYEELLEKFHNSLHSDHFISEELSVDVYNKLLRGFQKLSGEHIIISGSGKLHSLPFSAMQTERGQYLISDAALSYSPSASFKFLQEKSKEKAHIREALFIAPEFNNSSRDLLGNRDKLGDLIFNIPEVENSSKYIKGEMMIGQAVSKQRFLAQISEKDIIHFSSHAKSDPKFPDKSYLAFGHAEDEHLYLHELAQLNIPAHMMVLSACETNLGKNYKGEGAMSLANACFFSGVESVVATQWSVYDEPSSAIISTYYKFLAQGLPKDQALKEAQLEFLNTNAGEYLHPYYWAGFAIVGNTDRLYFTRFHTVPFIILVCLVLLVIFWYLRFFKK